MLGVASDAPRRDIIISIHPKHVANIVRRSKNHEFRNYLLPLSTKRLWIYETSPASSIRYVATISHGKRPGEIRDSSGLRNDEFDRGDLKDRVKYAYEIRKLEELPKPYSLEDLKRNGWLKGAPQKYCFVKPSMIALSVAPLQLVFDTVPIEVTQANDETGEGEVAIADAPAERRLRDMGRSPAGVRKSKKPPAAGTRKQALLQQWLGNRPPQ